MMRQRPQQIARAVRVYRLLLAAYPRTFRAAYGPEMLQLFRDCCPKTTERRAWAAFWLRMLGDTMIAAAWERIAEGRKHMASRRGTYLLLGGALIGAVGIGYVNTHTDETGIIAGSLFLVAVALSAVRPRWAGGWLLLVGVSVPVSQLAMYLLGLRVPYPNSLADIRSALIPAMIVATIGTVVGWGVERLVLRLPRAAN